MDQKYELTDNIQRTRNSNGEMRHVRQIRALKDFTLNDGRKVKKGDRGGYVSSTINLSQDGNCWIFDDATVIDNARVSDNAIVQNDALVEYSAQIKDEAVVKDIARVGQYSIISGRAIVQEESTIYGNSKVYDNAIIGGDAHLFHNTRVYGNAQVFGWTYLKEYARIYGNSIIGSRCGNYVYLGVAEDDDLLNYFPHNIMLGSCTYDELKQDEYGFIWSKH